MSQSFSNNINSLNSYTGVSVSNNFTFADDRSNILAWLSPLEPKLRHQDIRDHRVENVGEWLLQTQEFRRWCTDNEGGESGYAVLFCHGDPLIFVIYIPIVCEKAGFKETSECVEKIDCNVKYGEAGHHRDAGHMATVVKKGNNSTNS